MVPPPTWAGVKAEWYGVRTGRVACQAVPGFRVPETEWIRVVSSDSSRCRGGRIVAIRLASMVFPNPGGPIMRML